MDIRLTEIGYVVAREGGPDGGVAGLREPEYAVRLAPEYAAGIGGLEGFGHVVIVWYAHMAPAWDRSFLRVPKPYRLAPETLGIFATRSPYRPNGVCVSVAAVKAVDPERGVVSLWWMDAEDGTPVIDVKPYHPSADRIREPAVPGWCARWPSSLEESGGFDWSGEFLF